MSGEKARRGGARAIMVQGTMSNVGKSLIAAGLCRALARRGLSVAPFKSQNMALNSGVTRDGREMGRAQVIQAHAARVEPDVRMNPILLKPTSDTGSQVVVLGEPLATMGARRYAAFRRDLREVVASAYRELAQGRDVMVIEGAGSPAEINLNADDIVNMGMARMAHAPVILVADIDPGGVFAQVVGTLELLAPADRVLVRGVVINKFRGDPEILAPGLGQLEKLTGVPVLGVVPYRRFDLGDEDSLSARLDAGARGSGGPALPGCVDVAVVRLPHLSNFTDFDQLDRHPRARVRYVDRAEALGRPDLVVLPGTKATLDDLRWMRERGLDRCVRALAGHSTPVIGICGGYQMLGRELVDDLGSDGGGREEGLGLLPVVTEFSADKRMAQVTGRFDGGLAGAFSRLSGLPIEGYEVHMGRTRPQPPAGGRGGSGEHVRPAVLLGAGGGRPDGAALPTVMGTYVHGLFDARGVSSALVDALLERRGLAPDAPEAPDARAFEDRQLDLLADTLERSLDMDALMGIIERGVDDEARGETG
ncbi:MAG: cobyric acid synthase [Coriobacteriales bacterium]|jgi:adenosylcobyric acid synthase